MQALESELPNIAGDVLERVRAKRPRVHCITNAVAQNYTPNVLLAAGAIPSMTIAPKEVTAFAQRADALLVNLGTFDTERQKASLAAIAAVNKLKKPWVLDPVFIDRSPPRAAFALEQAGVHPLLARLQRFSLISATASNRNRRWGTRQSMHQQLQIDFIKAPICHSLLNTPQRFVCHRNTRQSQQHGFRIAGQPFLNLLLLQVS